MDDLQIAWLIIGWLLAFEDHAEIIGPVGLRTQLVELVGSSGDE